MKKTSLRPAFSAFVLMLTMSLLSTGLSFFVAPVCDDLSFGRGGFTLYYSLMVATGAVSTSILGAHMSKKGVRGVVLVSGIWCCLSLVGLSVSSALWMFYCFGAAMGFFGSTCIYLAANVIVQQSYTGENASTVLGMVMAGAGVGGVVWSNLVPRLLESLGWRYSYRILGVCWLVLAVIAVLILGKQEQSAGIFGRSKPIEGGISQKEALKSGRFYLAVMVMCSLTVASCISQQLPSVLGGMGHDGDQISIMLSVMTAFGAAGTIAEGIMCSKLGILKSMILVIAMYAVGYVLLLLDKAVYAALVCLAFGSGTIGTLMPIAVRFLFGGREYAAIWSVVITCSSVASFLATPVWGMVYDIFGTYAPALIAVPILLVASIFALLAAFRGTHLGDVQ